MDYISNLSLVYQSGHTVVEGDGVGQAQPAFHKFMLADVHEVTHYFCKLEVLWKTENKNDFVHL